MAPFIQVYILEASASVNFPLEFSSSRLHNSVSVQVVISFIVLFVFLGSW